MKEAKDTYIAWLIIFGIVWGVFVFVGYIASLRRTLISPKAESSGADRLRKSQQQIAEETEEKRKQLMENIKQKVEDNRRDF